MNDALVTIILSIFASTGFWAFVSTLVQKKDKKRDDRDKILMGLASMQIQLSAEIHFARGYISKGDYHILYDLLYDPYKALGGNGAIEKLMNQVDTLPLKED